MEEEASAIGGIDGGGIGGGGIEEGGGAVYVVPRGIKGVAPPGGGIVPGPAFGKGEVTGGTVAAEELPGTNGRTPLLKAVN